MKEAVYAFGANKSLMGIVTEPNKSAAVPHLPAVIILNSGLIQRVGPNRLSVKIARMLAEKGYRVLRFDFSGIGDSDQRQDTLPFDKSSVLETQEAMEFLEKTFSAQQFILTGICSGADTAFDTALTDSRVCGIIPIDLYSVGSRGYDLYAYKRRMAKLKSWVNLASGKSDLWKRLKDKLRDRSDAEIAMQNDAESLFSGVATPEDVLAGLQALIAKKIGIYLIYSDGSPAYYNFQTHFSEMWAHHRHQPGIEMLYLSKADHGFTLLSNQRLLLSAIDRWVENLVKPQRQAQPTT